MAFQNYVYGIISSRGTSLGVYPNFKQAYERLENYSKHVVAIIDKGDRYDDEATFEVVRKSGKYYIYDTFTIHRMLLTIWPDDKLISPDMIRELEEQNKKHGEFYKLLTDAI